MQQDMTRTATACPRRRGEPLARRQARVGIIANPATVSLPVMPPRDTWVRWPSLRSSRRAGRMMPVRDPAQLKADPILSGSALNNFARDIRDDSLAMPEDASGDTASVDVRDHNDVGGDASSDGHGDISAMRADLVQWPNQVMSVQLVKWGGLGLMCLATVLILLSFLKF